MQKKIIVALLLIPCLSMMSCKNEVESINTIEITSKNSNITNNSMNDELTTQRIYSENKWNHWAMVDNMPYFRTDKESNRIHVLNYSKILTGTNSVSTFPTENDTCNFGNGYLYSYTDTIDEIDVFIDDVWYVFERDMAEISVKISDILNNIVTLNVYNDKETMFMYGDNYTLEFLDGEVWVPVNYIGEKSGASSHSNILYPKSTQEVICDLNEFDISQYGSGTYRLTRFGSTLCLQL